MLDLAEGVMDLRVPVVLVIPLTLGFSILPENEEGEADTASDGGTAEADESDTDEAADGSVSDEAAVEGEGPDVADRDAFFIGLGDAVMPTVLVASAAHFSPAAPLELGIDLALNLPALTAMIGTFLGLFVLLRMVFAGRAHAGLPLLNGGAIGGYLLGSVAAGVPILTALGL
jgi:presenilin-like A22 family membrane protease